MGGKKKKEMDGRRHMNERQEAAQRKKIKAREEQGIEETLSGSTVSFWTSESLSLPLVAHTHSPKRTQSLHGQAEINGG